MLWGSSGERAGLTVTAYNKMPDIWKQSPLYLWAVITHDICLWVYMQEDSRLCKLCVCAGWMVLIMSFEVVVILEYSGTNYTDCQECGCCKYVMNAILPGRFLLHIQWFLSACSLITLKGENAFLKWLRKKKRLFCLFWRQGEKLAS